jgi:hypothetical protein
MKNKLQVITDRLHWYEEIMEKPPKNMDILRYKFDGCSVCREFRAKDKSCMDCPIKDSNSNGCFTNVRADLVRTINNTFTIKPPPELMELFRARYEEIIKLLELNGYEYK